MKKLLTAMILCVMVMLTACGNGASSAPEHKQDDTLAVTQDSNKENDSSKQTEENGEIADIGLKFDGFYYFNGIVEGREMYDVLRFYPDG